MSSGDSNGRVAYVEDADDSGNAIPDTETYAASIPASPIKQQPNTSRTRREKVRRTGSSSPAAAGQTDSDSTVHPSSDAGPDSRTKSRDKDRTKEKTKSSSHKKSVTISRPPAKHSKTAPMSPRRADDASYYGVAPTVTAAKSRPRAQTSLQRPSSYYGPESRPPQANVRWYDQMYSGPPTHPPPSHLPSTNPLLPTSYPPHVTSHPRSLPFTATGPVISQAADDYLSRRTQLASRFSLNRPASANAHRVAHPVSFEYEIEDDRLAPRRLSFRTREQEDRVRMPPPPRPMSARPQALAFRAPPGPVTKSFDDEAFRGDSRRYQEVSPHSSYEYISNPPSRRLRRQSIGAAAGRYDVGQFRAEVAASGSNRRNSYYGQSPGGGYEDKVKQAAAYQQDVNGGPAMPLTAESLRKASKNGGPSSRSTRSSASKDESDYKHSATTRTTRSSGEEDVTIRVKGNAVLKVGGTEMQCGDGAEINIISRGGSVGFRGGSDRSSYIDAEERRSRMDRAATRTRASSQAASYSRTIPIPAAYDHHAYRGSPSHPYHDYTAHGGNFV